MTDDTVAIVQSINRLCDAIDRLTTVQSAIAIAGPPVTAKTVHPLMAHTIQLCANCRTIGCRGCSGRG